MAAANLATKSYSDNSSDLVDADLKLTPKGQALADIELIRMLAWGFKEGFEAHRARILQICDDLDKTIDKLK